VTQIVSPRRFLHRLPSFSGASLGNHILQTGAVNLALGIVGLCTGAAAARLLGPQGRGELAAIQNWPILLAALSTLGIPDALVYYASRSRALLGTVAGTCASLMAIGAIPCALLGWLVIPFALKAQALEVMSAARWYLWYIPLFIGTGIPLSMLRSLDRVGPWNVLRLLAPLPWIATLFVAWFDHQHSAVIIAQWLLMATLAFSLVEISIALALIPCRWAFQLRLCKPVLRFSVPVFLSWLPQNLNLRLDQLLMAAFLPARILGFYAIAVAWSALLTPATSALSALLFPKVSAMRRASDQVRMIGRLATYNVVLSLAGTMVLTAVTPWFLPKVFGLSFRPSILPAIILLWASVFSSLNSVLEEGFKGMGRPRLVLWAEALGLVLTLSLLKLLLQSYLAVGAALASLAAYGLTTGFLLVQFRLHRSKATSRLADTLEPACSDGDENQ